MRTRSVAERSTIKEQQVEHHIWVEVENADRTFIDITTWLESAEWGESIDQPTGTFTVRFRRDDETASLAPTIGGSTLNRNNAGAYAPLLQSGRNLKIWTAVVDPGVDPLTKKKLAFWGRVDRVKWNTSPIEVTGRDLGGWVVDAYIQVERVIGSSTPTAIETLMAQVLANDPVFGSPTLFTPTSPGFLVSNPTKAKQAQKSVLEALQQDYALSLGWVCRYRFDNGTDTPRLTFFDINRAKSVVDDTFGPDEYQDITSLEVDDSEVRNYIVGTYYDTAGKRHSRHVENGVSQGKYGVKFMQINLAIGDPINTDAEMDTMLNAAVSDLGAPLTTQEMQTLYYWPIQLGDLYAFLSNTDHYDSTQNLAVVGYTHKFENGQGVTTMQCRGSVIGAYHGWYRRGTNDGTTSQTGIPVMQQVSVAFPSGVATVEVIARGDLNTSSWRIALSTTAQPDLAATRAAPVYSGQNIDALISQSVSTGQKLYISALAYSDTTGVGAESDFFQSSTIRDGAGGAIMPVPNIELVFADWQNFDLTFHGTFSPGAPLPRQFRYGITTDATSSTITWSDWTDASFLPYNFGLTTRQDKAATYVYLEVRQGSDNTTIQRETIVMDGTDIATGSDGKLIRSVPFGDGNFALKATDTGGWIANSGVQESGLKAINLLLAKPLSSSPDNLNSVNDSTTRAAVAAGIVDLNNIPLYISIPDTRSVNHTPSYYSKNVRGQFKDATVIGIPGAVTGQFAQVLGWRGWTDDAGFGAGELAVHADGRLYFRYGSNAGGWNAWNELARKSEVLSLSSGGTIGGTVIVSGGAINVVLDQQAFATRPSTASTANYWAWYASGGSTRRGYIGFGGGTNAGAPLYINSDTGPVYIQIPTAGVVAQFTSTSVLFNRGLELTSGSHVIANGEGYYARRSTSNAVIRCIGYDSGTDDLSIVMGGSVLRVRDTGSGVPMSLTATGALTVKGSGNAFFTTDRTSGGQFAFYATGGYGILWSDAGIDVLKVSQGGTTTLYGELWFNTSGRFNTNSAGLSLLTQAGAAWGVRAKWGLFSDSYLDESLVPATGIYSKGGMLSGGDVVLNVAGKVFKNNYGHKMAPIIDGGSSTPGTTVAADGTLWVKSS